MGLPKKGDAYDRLFRAPEEDVPSMTFPSTRFYGSKRRQLSWLQTELSRVQGTTALDAFGGTGAVSYLLGKLGFQTTDGLLERGPRRHGYAESFVAGVPANVAVRELAVIGAGMGWADEHLLHRGLPGEQGPGNALLVTLEHEHVTEVFAGFGEKSVRAETVAKHVLQEVRAYLTSTAAVGEHLADQLMLPMALAGGGSFSTSVLSSHATTNAEVISRFLPVRFQFAQQTAARYLCTLT